MLWMAEYIWRRTFRSVIPHECACIGGYGMEVVVWSCFFLSVLQWLVNLVMSQYDAGQLLTGLAPSSHMRVAYKPLLSSDLQSQHSSTEKCGIGTGSSVILFTDVFKRANPELVYRGLWSVVLNYAFCFCKMFSSRMTFWRRVRIADEGHFLNCIW